ncbi:IgG-binding virulence factor TspB family protein [Neisseria meningitidis]|uniref:IgG-binding virulence factor TspB family protein n=1 Tax=Neisseria meningitidis TaxID=487 RepID=UPI0038F72900
MAAFVQILPRHSSLRQAARAQSAEDLNLPSETVNVEFKKSGIFQDSAQCPPPLRSL